MPRKIKVIVCGHMDRHCTELATAIKGHDMRCAKVCSEMHAITDAIMAAKPAAVIFSDSMGIDDIKQIVHYCYMNSYKPFFVTFEDASEPYFDPVDKSNQIFSYRCICDPKHFAAKLKIIINPSITFLYDTYFQNIFDELYLPNGGKGRQIIRLAVLLIMDKHNFFEIPEKSLYSVLGYILNTTPRNVNAIITRVIEAVCSRDKENVLALCNCDECSDIPKNYDFIKSIMYRVIEMEKNDLNG